MGLIRMGPPTELITKLATEFGIKNFIETGTYYGGTAIWASQNFSHVFTIEYSQQLHEEAVHKFNHINNIKFIFGDSRAELKKLVEQLDGISFFWLDAHWSGDITYGENDECPLVEEINILNKSKFENFILIDDARLFTSPPEHPHKMEQWPDITAVINALNSGDSDRYIVIIEDVIVAVPNFTKATVAQYCQKVNGEAWEEYCQQLRTSNLEKGLQLIYQYMKQKLVLLKRIIRAFSFKKFTS